MSVTSSSTATIWLFWASLNFEWKSNSKCHQNLETTEDDKYTKFDRERIANVQTHANIPALFS